MPWVPLVPAALPTWRRRLIALYDEPFSREALARALEADRYDYVPHTETVDQAIGLITAQQQARLARARLYIAGPSLADAAVARAARAKSGPVTQRRIPGWRHGYDCGLMIFMRPLAHLTTHVRNVSFNSPIVAASWGSWPDPCVGHDRTADAPGARGCPRWLIRSSGRHATRCVGEEPSWVLLTLYLCVTSGLNDLARLLGTPRAAAAVGPMASRFPLVPAGDLLVPVRSGTEAGAAPEEPAVAAATVAVRTAWNLWPHGHSPGAPDTAVTSLTQRPSRQRADRRRGITDDGTVRVVDLPAGHRRHCHAGQQLRGARTSDTDYVWQERREIDPYSRYQCQNTRLHAQDPDLLLHEHTLTDVRGYTAGPPGAPVRRRETVYRTK